MVQFNEIYTEYENTKDVCKFCEIYKENSTATRFLLIRSLDKPSLTEIVEQYSAEDTSGNMKILTEKAFHSSVTIQQLVEYIEKKRTELIAQREEELNGLQNILNDFPIVNCGVRNDKVDDIIKPFVRNKSLKSFDTLIDELDNSVLPRIHQYCLWSYYNQTSNDIIELFFLKHPAVLPTLRKIHDIDFFIKVDEQILPFDLKFTHISDSYFDLASQGIIRNMDISHHDDFYIENDNNENEMQKIKSFYKNFKKKNRNLNLPNLKGLKKNDLCDLLVSSGDPEAIDFINKMKDNHSNYVPSTSEELHSLEWWNYKYQGERLFCNNNRLFIFLAFKHKFVDGRELKGKTFEIGNKIKDMLDNITNNGMHTVKYFYDKEASLEGNYTALSLSAIYAE